MNNIISVQDLEKIYRIPVRKHGLASSVKSLVRPAFTDVVAVKKISFDISEGQIIGFIGPNGAGKTTTLKMLSGILYPTSGSVNVAGFTPSDRKPEYLRKIGMVMGNKTQADWTITVLDTFYIIKEIYHVSDFDFKNRLDEFVGMLNIDELLPKLTRNLSLGERAKCEFIAALLYRPGILYLDEPTLGLDVSTQIALRSFIKEYNRKYNTTVILTSHYMADITSLCRRVLLINKGNLVYDGDLRQLANKIAPFKLIRISFAENEGKNSNEILELINCGASVISDDEQGCTLRVRREDMSAATALLLSNLDLIDLTVEDPPIEAVIDRTYREGKIA